MQPTRPLIRDIYTIIGDPYVDEEIVNAQKIYVPCPKKATLENF